jgi:hypothetical protein
MPTRIYTTLTRNQPFERSTELQDVSFRKNPRVSDRYRHACCAPLVNRRGDEAELVLQPVRQKRGAVQTARDVDHARALNISGIVDASAWLSSSYLLAEESRGDS